MAPRPRRALQLIGCESPLVRDPLSAEQAGTSLIASHAGGEACVCELTGFFEVSEPTISHHLKALREAGLVTSQRRASWVYYRVVPEALSGLSALLDATGTSRPVSASR
jgi:ArsR family transcriptional regulator